MPSVAETAAEDADPRLRPADMFRLRLPADLCLTPDGRCAVVVVEEHLQKADRSIRNLWLVDLAAGGMHRLTRFAGREGSPRVSPDGSQLAFLADRPRDLEARERGPEHEEQGAKPGREGADEARTQVWCLDLAHGGEPRQVTRLEEGVQDFDWSPDGLRLVLSARSPDADQRRRLGRLREGKGPHVIDRTQHKFDGRGYLDDVRSHLYVVEVASGDARKVTDGPCSERLPAWSPDGRWIAFQSNRTGDEDNNRRTDLWLVAPDGGETRRLTRGDLQCGRPVWSPDSRRVATIAATDPENEYALSHLAVVDLETAQPVDDLAACVGVGFAEVGGVVPDQVEGSALKNARRYPRATDRTPVALPARALDRGAAAPIVWLDGERLVCLAGDRGQTRVLLAHLESGEARLCYPFDRGETLEAMDVAAGRVAVVVASPERGKEVAALDVAHLEAAAPAGVRSAFFAPVLAARTLAPYRRIAYRSGDGQAVEALVALPPGFDPEHPAPTPLLVSIHGGPAAYDAPTFRLERQCWAAQGYLVLMVNYRGSTSYGEAFCMSIRGDWGPREQDDMMSGVEHLVSLGWADPERLFVTGFSYGGIMTNWAVGHTDRFRAAVSEHGVWDYAAAFGTDDCHLWWQDDLGVPWQNPEGYRRTSPSSAVASVRTPVLIMGGAEDWRCPLDQSELMYVALKKRGVETRLVVYPGEHHAVSKPSRALDRLERIGAWLEAHGGLPMVAVEATPAPEAQTEQAPEAV